MNPTLDEDTVLQRFERGNAFEIRNGVMFDFYLELPHILSTVYVGGTEMYCRSVRPTWHLRRSHQSLRERRDEGHDHCYWYVGTTNQIVDWGPLYLIS